uniref:PfkB domain-containing protein n=1 Tax=Rhabditophanes sp. KR3021 TaxID=114890 RepID=A0AC35TNB7_9BILA
MLLNKIHSLFHTRFASNKLNNKLFKVSEDVAKALELNKGIVALESTVITHGLPYPENVKLAIELEEIVIREGCVPATISIMDGYVNIGTSRNQLEKLGSSCDSVKVAGRDIVNCLMSKQNGGTTVSATMRLAKAAGIHVFATGGIGGVHRGAENTFDISADLIELSKTPMLVVCSGAKSILDIPKTLEFLETHGVNVIVNSDDSFFPGFFVPKSIHKAPFFTSSLEEIVENYKVGRILRQKEAHLIAVPIPEKDSSDGSLIEDAIQEAVAESKEQNINSKEVTPFILKRVRELSKGVSLTANQALLKNNAMVGAKLAALYSSTKNSVLKNEKTTMFAPRTQTIVEEKPPIVTCIGASILDIDAMSDNKLETNGGTYNGKVVLRAGGVARNHADALTRLGVNTQLISAIGTDHMSEILEKLCKHMNIEKTIRVNKVPLPIYSGITRQGNVLCGILNVEEMMNKISPELLMKNEEVIASSKYVVLDGNLSKETIKKASEICSMNNVGIWFEPADKSKVYKMFYKKHVLKGIRYFSPNAKEFEEYCKILKVDIKPFASFDQDYVSNILKNQHHKLCPSDLQEVIVTLDEKGITGWDNLMKMGFSKEAPIAINREKIVSASGAGDCFNSGYISGLVKELERPERLNIANKSAKCSLLSSDAVPSTITNNI